MDDDKPARRPSEYHGAGTNDPNDMDQGHRKILEPHLGTAAGHEEVAKGMDRQSFVRGARGIRDNLAPTLRRDKAGP